MPHVHYHPRNLADEAEIREEIGSYGGGIFLSRLLEASRTQETMAAAACRLLATASTCSNSSTRAAHPAAPPRSQLLFYSPSTRPPLSSTCFSTLHSATNTPVVRASSSSSATTSASSTDAQALSSLTIFTADGAPVKFQELWDQTTGTAVVAFLRHFGCPLCWEFAASLRDARSRFDAAGVKLIAIGVGTPEKAQILAERLPFPKDCLYADPDRKAYEALGLYYGLGRTFFNPASAKVLGRFDTIREALKGYTLEATPEDRSSVLQQGGLYIFKGTQLLYSRKDEGTGDHASLEDVFQICCTASVV